MLAGRHIGVTDELRPQKRGRKIAMTDAELRRVPHRRAHLPGRDDRPGRAARDPALVRVARRLLWLYSITRSQRWADLQRDPRISAVVDTGHDFLELRGVEITGTVEVVGEVPRTGEPNDELAPIEPEFFAKYFGGGDDVPRRPARLAQAHPDQDHQLGLPQDRRPG